MNASGYKYGTTSTSKEEKMDIKFVRSCANRYLNGEKTVYITKHALDRANERKIFVDDAIETISDNYFIEFQPARSTQADSRTLFYSGHHTQIIAVNTLQDIFNQKITLLTVEHKDTRIWKDIDAYIERI